MPAYLDDQYYCNWVFTVNAIGCSESVQFYVQVGAITQPCGRDNTAPQSEAVRKGPSAITSMQRLLGEGVIGQPNQYISDQRDEGSPGAPESDER